MMKTKWEGKTVLILGAARQGLALAQYLASQGAVVTVNDSHPVEQMSEAVAALTALPIHWVFGSHPIELLTGQSLLCVSGGVPLNLPIVEEAIRRGLPVSNDSQIFMESIQAKTIGITGSAGKTTTTTLVGRMANHAFGDHAWIGGNIGNPLITQAEQIKSNDLVILELSSFQLEQMTHSPHIAAVLNITPNHLDRHGTLAAYAAAKQHILDYQSVNDIAILNREDAGSWALRSAVKGQLISFGLQKPAEEGWQGTYLEYGVLYMRNSSGEDIPLLTTDEIHLRGLHNIVNVLAATAIGFAAGIPIESIRQGVHNFSGVAHRLEFVRNYHGADWYNDSIATAPERTMAAINAFDEPIVLLLGGRDKKLPWDTLAHKIHQRVDHVVVFGEAAGLIIDALGPTIIDRKPYSIDHCKELHEAVQKAATRVEAGDVVLLSPGGTSYDAFKDFEERGEWYRKWVNELS
jgi:UDP-N-acetylmuramoylalanine--D-glutamate ligase